MFYDIAHALGGFDFASKVFLAVVPLSGVLGGAFAAWLVAGRNVYINSITAERSKWLEKLRTSISTFQAAISTYNFRHHLPADARRPETANQPNFFEGLERATLLASNIQLQLNPDGPIDQNIIALVRALSLGRHGAHERLTKVEDLLTLHSQWLLKAEWEKVKWEAGGLLYRLSHWFDEDNRRIAYRNFAVSVGSINAAVLNLGESAGFDWKTNGPLPPLPVEVISWWLLHKRIAHFVRH